MVHYRLVPTPRHLDGTNRGAATIRDNDAAVFSGNRTTTAPGGSFEVETRTANRAGADRIVATARLASTGQTCTGTVTL